LYKVKPKLPNQFKAVDAGQIPLSVILGEDEVAAGKVKVKENGLREGHPEKEGVLIDLENLVPEIQKRLDKIANLDAMVQQADGLKVVGGIKGDKKDVEEAKQTTEAPQGKENEKKEQPGAEAPKLDPQPETEKPKEESELSQENIGAVPAS